MTSMLKVAAVLGATMIAVPAAAQTKVAIGISGWTGFAPLTLAKEAGMGVTATQEENRVVLGARRVT